MKILVVLLMLGGILVSLGIMVDQFGDTGTFVERGKDIVIADCLAIPTNKVVIKGGHQVIESFSGGPHPVEVRVIRSLKGGKQPGKQTIATIYDMTPGKRYLLCNSGGLACGTDFLAIPQLSVVEISEDFDLKRLDDKPVSEQVFLLFADRFAHVKIALRELEQEKGLLEMAVPYSLLGDALHLGFVSAKKNWIAGEPIILSMTVTNCSQEETTVFLGEAAVGAISFSTNKTEWFRNTLHRRSGLLPGPLRTLAGHAAFTNHVVLDQWLRLTAGLHQVSAHIAQSGGKAISSESTVLVLPPDPAQLRDRVSDLVKTARASRRFEQREACVTALRALYRLSPEGRELLTNDLKVARELMVYIESDPSD